MPDQTPPSAAATAASTRLRRLITDPHHPHKPRIWLTYHLPPQTLLTLQRLSTITNTPLTIHQVSFRTLTATQTTISPQDSPSPLPPPGSSS